MHPNSSQALLATNSTGIMMPTKIPSTPPPAPKKRSAVYLDDIVASETMSKTRRGLDFDNIPTLPVTHQMTLNFDMMIRRVPGDNCGFPDDPDVIEPEGGNGKPAIREATPLPPIRFDEIPRNQPVPFYEAVAAPGGGFTLATTRGPLDWEWTAEYFTDRI